MLENLKERIIEKILPTIPPPDKDDEILFDSPEGYNEFYGIKEDPKGTPHTPVSDIDEQYPSSCRNMYHPDTISQDH